MKPLPSFTILFLIIPLVEIYFFVKVGGSIGGFKTVLLTIATAFVGAFFMRQQGMATLGRFQKNFVEGRVPAGEILEGIILLIGGVLLLLPGFFTDTLGFLCLIPFTRQLISTWMVKHSSLQSAGGSSFEPHAERHDHVIDGEFIRKSEDKIGKD